MKELRNRSVTGLILAWLTVLPCGAQIELGQSFCSVFVLCDGQQDLDTFDGVGAFEIKAGPIGECFSSASGNASSVVASARMPDTPNGAVSLNLQTFFEVSDDGPVPLSWDLGVTDGVAVVDIADLSVVYQAQNGQGGAVLNLSKGVPYRLSGQINQPKGHTRFFGLGEAVGCAPDLDANGILDLFDFLGFVNLFNVGDPAADFDGDGVLDLFDFLAFTNAFNVGC
jgi:hypothetical protein